MATAEEMFRKYLEKKGQRYTRERRLILEEVMSKDEHFEAEDIVLRLRDKGARVSTASVYRTLPLLIQAGIIIKNTCDFMSARLEHVHGHDHHDHLVCLGCNKIIEFKNEEIEKRQKEVVEKYGFDMAGHRLVIRGYCRECSRDNMEQSRKRA